MKAHQCRVIGPVSLAKQIPTTLRVAYLAVEPQSTLKIIIQIACTISTIGRFAQFILASFSEHAVFAVSHQQKGLSKVALLLLAQWLLTEIKIMSLNISLFCPAQEIVLIKAQGFIFCAVLDAL